MAKTYDYISERRLLYFTQKLKEHIPTASDFIDDLVSAINKTYSSQKIENLLSDKVDVESGKGLSTNDFNDDYKELLDNFDDEILGIIDDNSLTSLNKTWSAKKIHDEITAITGIEFKKVSTLPTVGAQNVIYLIPVKIITATTTVSDVEAIVNKSKFVSKISTSGTYLFTYNVSGTSGSWQYGSVDVDLDDYGISFSSSTVDLSDGDQIIITLSAGTNPNVYEEYIWIASDSLYEILGTTEADLSGYVKTEDIIEITTSEIDTIINTVFS